jgi:23S rRNA (cytidine1920-2'-O)/16S rRNA (cytidine1409-2'-O)-methyltransferase
MAKGKLRIDQLLVERGLAESRTLAQRLVMAGQVRVNGELVHKSSETVTPDVILDVEGGPRYVSRAGEKLEASLDAFQISPEGRICADVGSSTGGFTDCLLQHGAQRVYAIDVGKGQLHWKLRQDDRVEVLEDTNARYLEVLPEAVSLVSVDVSFISALRILAPAAKWLRAEGDVIVLVKPQFEAGPEKVGKGGIVKDPAVHKEVLEKVLQGASKLKLHAHGLIRSPLLGAKGNQEYLAWLRPVLGDVSTNELLESVSLQDRDGV